ncbi:pyridoxamine 5'-phosphate oxidase family protein [soil metagenome]
MPAKPAEALDTPEFVIPDPDTGSETLATDTIAAKFLGKLEESPFVMIALDGRGHSEPLTALIDDHQPNALFFFVAKDNRIAKGGPAMAQFASKGHDFFACMSGIIARDFNRQTIDRLWSAHVESWFEGGKDDPNLAMLRFDVQSAELWESDVSLAGRVKMLFGAKMDADAGGHAVVSGLG